MYSCVIVSAAVFLGLYSFALMTPVAVLAVQKNATSLHVIPFHNTDLTVSSCQVEVAYHPRDM